MALQMDDFCRAIRSGTAPRSSPQLGLDVVQHDRGGRAVAHIPEQPVLPGVVYKRAGSLTYASERAGMRIAEPIAAGRGDHRLRVLVLTNMYPTRAEPHFGCFVRDQVDDLRRLGVDVTVLAFDGRGHKRRYAAAGPAAAPGAAAATAYDIVHAHYGLSGASRPRNSQRRW